MGSVLENSGLDTVLEELRQFFAECDKYVPILGPVLEMLTQIPEAREAQVYHLAELYGQAEERYRDHYQEINRHLNDLARWQGDGAAQRVRDDFQNYLTELEQTMQALGGMRDVTQAGALGFETMKLMAIVNLLMLAYAIMQAIMLLWTGFAVGAVPVAIGAARVAIRKAAQDLIQKLTEAGLSAAGRLALGATKTALTTAGRRIVEGGIREVAKTAAISGARFAGFTLATQGGITAIEVSEGHTGGWKALNQVVMGTVDGFITGAIGGPLARARPGLLFSSGAFTVGQAGDNLIQMGRDRLLDAAGLTAWAQRNGLYSGMTLQTMTKDLGRAALQNVVMDGAHLREVRARLSVEASARNLFGASHSSSSSGSAGALDHAGSPVRADAPSALTSDGRTSSHAPALVGPTAEHGSPDPLRAEAHPPATTTGQPRMEGSAGNRPDAQAPSSGSTRADGTSAASSRSETFTASTGREQGRTGTADGGSQSGSSEPVRATAAHRSPDTGGSAPRVTDPDGAHSAPTVARAGDGGVPGHSRVEPSVPGPRGGEPVVPDHSPANLTPARGGESAAPAHLGADPTASPTRGSVDGTAPPARSSMDGTAADRATAGAPGRSSDHAPVGREGSAGGQTARSGDAPARPADAARAGAGADRPGRDGAPQRQGAGASDAMGPRGEHERVASGPHDRSVPDGSARDASGARDSHGHDGGRQPEPPFWEWKKKAELAYAHTAARGFDEGAIKVDGAPVRLNGDLVRRAMDTPSESLNSYGKRLKTLIEHHFTHVDENGVRRPLSEGAIADKVHELAGSHPPRDSVAHHAPDSGAGPRRTPDETATLAPPAATDPHPVSPHDTTGEPTRSGELVHTASPIADTGFVPDGRPAHYADVTVGEFRDAAMRTSVHDFGSRSIGSVWPDGPFVRVETVDGQVHHFQPEVGHGQSNVSETVVRSGTREDPHLVRVNDRVAPEQLGRTWVHEISETLQAHAAATHRAEPQGIVRRMLNKLGRVFGLADTPTRSPLPETDPHTTARLDERRYLMREFGQARTPQEQLRLRHEIHGVDRDLGSLGHSTHGLTPVPEVNHAAARPASPADPLRHADPPPPPESSHDHIWNDRPWEREGRPPSLDELIPSTNAEVARWEGAVREEFARQLDGREFAGLRVRLDVSDPLSVSVYRNSVTVRVEVVYPETGYVGRVVRTFSRDHSGDLYVEHNVARHRFGEPGYPTPREVSHAGWNGERGPDASWIGKRAMLGSLWEGLKPLGDTGAHHAGRVDHPRVEPEHRPDAGDGRDMFTGGSIRPRDEVRAWEWADQAYDRFRLNDADIAEIANNLAAAERPSGHVGFRPEEVAQIKRHLMVEEHLLDDFAGGHIRQRFDASPDIAEAWIRLREGRPLEPDVVLLEHELTESNYLRAHPGATYREAHDYANSHYNWYEIRPGRTGEDFGPAWGRDGSDGNTYRLPQSPGGQSGGGIHLRLSGDGPPLGHRQGDQAGEAAYRAGGQQLRGGVRQDTAVSPESVALSGEGLVRRVAEVLGRADRHELAITRSVEEAAGEGGGIRTKDSRPRQETSLIQRRMSGELAESSPGRSLDQIANELRTPLRYTVELPHEGYADGLRRTVDDLIGRGYEPVRFDSLWAEGRPGGVVTGWRDPSTGQEFQVRIDTPESRAAHVAIRNRLEARRAGANPVRQQELLAREHEARALVGVPDGLGAIHPSDRGPATDAVIAGTREGAHTAATDLNGQHPPAEEPGQWNGQQSHEQLPLVHGAEAIQAVRDFVTETPSGIEFTGDPKMRRYAEALQPEPDVVKIALHGLHNGEVVVGSYRMSGTDFARGLADLQHTGRIDLGASRIKLISCYSGVGDRSLASSLARELGREVTGATEKVWSYLDGTETVASPNIHNRRAPTEPADGGWRTFRPDGRKIGSPPASPQGVPPTSGPLAPAGGGSRAGPILHVGSDGLLHANGDSVHSHRSEDSKLHRTGDRKGTFRDSSTERLHHAQDAGGTYRTENGFALRSADTGKPVPDPLTDRSRPILHHAAEGPWEAYHSRHAPDPVVRAAQQLESTRQALEHFRSATLRPLMDELGVRNVRELSASELRHTLGELRKAHAADPARLPRIRELEAAATEHAQRVEAVRRASAEIPRAAARHVLADHFGIHGDEVIAGQPAHGGRRGGEFAVAGFDRANHRLVVLETSGTKGTRHLLQNGGVTERGTPQHVRDVLQTSPRLHEHLRRLPDLLDEVHRALRRGDLTVEFHRLEVDVAGKHNVSISTRRLDLNGLDLHGVADRLPPPSGAGDARLGERLHEAAQRIADVFGPTNRRHGIEHAVVVNDHTIEVRPGRGKPYRLEIGIGARDGNPFTVTLGEDGVHRIEFSPDHADGLDRAGLDRLVTRALGHVNGEVSVSRGGRLGRFLGLYGGRLNSHDALVNDPVPGRQPRPSHTDVVRLAEFDALARLYDRSTGLERAAIEVELGRFIERHGLREGAPGADVRVALARRHLSESASALLDVQREWRRDSDPVVAGTRKVLADFAVTRASIEPVPVRDAHHFRVDPEGWNPTGRATFSYELRSGTVSDGRVAEFHGSGEKRHFVLVVDRGSFDLNRPGGERDLFAERRFRIELGRVFDEMIARQHARPEEVALRLRDRLSYNAPTAAAASTMFEVANLLNSPALTTKGLAAAAVDLATNNSLNRRVSLARAEGEHNRALTALPDRTGIDEGGLQLGVDRSFHKAGDLAESVLGDRQLMSRTVTPDPVATPDSTPIAASEAGSLRDRTGQEINKISRMLTQEPIEHLRKVRQLSGDRYRLVVRGDGNDATVHVEAAHTGSPHKIEMHYTDGKITMRVPPELAQAAPHDFHTAVREALTEATQRQHRVSRDEAGLAAHAQKGAALEVRQGVTTYPVAELVANNLGKVLVPSSVARAMVQAITDRVLGHRGLALADLRARHDGEYSTRLDAGVRRNIGNQIIDLAGNGRSLAQAIADRAFGPQHGPHTSPPPATPPSHQAAVSAARHGMDLVNDRHGGRFEVVKEVYDDGRNLTKVVYRLDQRGRMNDVEVRLTFKAVEDGRAVVPSGQRVRLGRFELTVNIDAAPARVAETLARIGDNIMFDREHPVPLRRRLYEDFMPAGARALTSVLVGVVTHSAAAGALAGVGAGMHMVSTWVNRMHQLRLNDIELNKTLSDTHHDDVTPHALREQIGAQRDPVRDLEQRARDIERQLAGDPRTATQVEALHHRYGGILVPDHVLLPEVDRLVAAFSDLPRGAKIFAVADAEHTFRLSFKGPKGRAETLTFEIGSGSTRGDAPVIAHRVNSDVTHALRVEPTRPPQEIARGVHDWLAHEINRVSQGPTGLLSPKARFLSFARDVGGQAFAAGVSLTLGKHPNFAHDVAVQAASTGNAAAGSGARELTKVLVDGHQAVSTQTRGELTKRHFGTAPDEQLAVFRADADHLLDRTWWAYDRLQHLERIAEALPPHERPELFRNGPLTRSAAPAVWGDETSGVSARSVQRVQQLELELGRQFFVDPDARRAAGLALDRLVNALTALHHPDRSRAEIEAILFADDFRNAGQVSARSTTLAEVHATGNLRMLMTAFYNGVLESHHPLDLTNTLTRVLREDGWESRLHTAGLDVEQLRPVRDRLLAAEHPNLMNTPILAGDTGHARLIVAEHAASQEARAARTADEQRAYLKDRRDLAAQGTALHEAEYRALREHDRITLIDQHSQEVPLHELPYTASGVPDVNALMRRPGVRAVHVNYEQDAHGGFVTDATGSLVVRNVWLEVVNGERVVNPRDHDLRPGQHGPELPLGWIDGTARYGMDPAHDWYRELADERGMPVTAGISGTATRLLTAFGWLRVPEVERQSFLHALLGWMLPAGDHSLYEVLRGAQLAAPELLGDPGRGFASVGDMVDRIPGLSDERFAEIVGRAVELSDPVRVADPGLADSLGHAAQVRTDAGEINDQGLRRLLDSIPTVPGLDGHPSVRTLADLLHHGGPEGSPGAGQRAALLRYAAESLGRPSDGLQIEQVGGPGGAKGAPGAPVFWVRDGNGELLAVVKVFPKVDEFARELSALQRLHDEPFERLDVPDVLGIGVARATDATAGVLISSVASGRPLDDLMVAARDAPAGLRDGAVADLSRAMRDTGAAMAELHNSPADSGGPVADPFPDRHGTRRAADALREWAGHEGFQRRYGFDGDRLIRRFEELGAAMRRDPGAAALVHGDPHPGNFFHDPLTGRVTVIDLEGMHSSMDAHGRPVGAAALDVGVFEQMMSAFAHNFDIAPLLPELQRHFFDGYQAASARPLPPEAFTYYRVSGLALALHGTRRMLFGEVPRDNAIAPENLARRAHEQLTQVQRLLDGSDGDGITAGTTPRRPAGSEGDGPDLDLSVPASLDHRLSDYLNQSEVTPAGRSFYEPHDTEMRASAQAVVPEPGLYTVDMHGDAYAVYIGFDQLSVDDLALLLEHDPNWNAQPVRLFACETGQADDGFAQQLADRLGVVVTAPTELAWSEADGTAYVSSDGGVDVYGNPMPTEPHDGQWRVFHPNGDGQKETS